jgi:predicted cupin superfamily sugar epimerase
MFVSVDDGVYSLMAACKGLFWMAVGKTACGNGLTRVDERRVTADEIIALLKLKPHPKEGGFYSETWRADETISAGVLPARYPCERSFSTCIYYLLAPGTFSAIHRLQSDEVFHFYLGDPVEMLQLRPDGTGKTLVLGTDLRAGMTPQVVVPHGVWQGARLVAGGKFALLGCTVAPGFDFADYEHGRREDLMRSYPQFREKIVALTVE